MSAPTTIRCASERDFPAVRGLFAATRRAPVRSLEDAELTTVPGARYVLVLDGQTSIIGAAMVTLDQDRGQLRYLAVEPELAVDPTIEERLFAVADAMCEAYGARSLDILPSSRPLAA